MKLTSGFSFSMSVCVFFSLARWWRREPRSLRFSTWLHFFFVCNSFFRSLIFDKPPAAKAPGSAPSCSEERIVFSPSGAIFQSKRRTTFSWHGVSRGGVILNSCHGIFQLLSPRPFFEDALSLVDIRYRVRGLLRGCRTKLFIRFGRWTNVQQLHQRCPLFLLM